MSIGKQLDRMMKKGPPTNAPPEEESPPPLPPSLAPPGPLSSEPVAMETDTAKVEGDVEMESATTDASKGGGVEVKKQAAEQVPGPAPGAPPPPPEKATHAAPTSKAAAVASKAGEVAAAPKPVKWK